MARASKETGKPVPGFTASFGERLQSVISRIGTLEKAREASGASVDQLTSWKFGRSRPDLFAIQRLCIEAGVPIDWLVSDVTPAEPKPSNTSADRHEQPVGQGLSNMATLPQHAPSYAAQMVFVPRLDVEAAAGAGAVVEQERVAEMLGFSENWLRARHITPASARIVTARGDSMEPTIRDGDFLIVDTSISEAVDNGIYVLTFNGVVLVKRLFITRNGGLVISSDNKIAGRDEEIPPHEVPEIHIAGRVMWYGRTI